MVDHDLLHSELANLASLTSGDFDLHEGLHRLSVTAANGLGIDGAGVMVRMPAGGTAYITATNENAMHVERQQDALQEGACVDAIKRNDVVTVSDVAAVSHWPRYATAVREAGFTAVAGVPVPLDGRNIGALNLYAGSSRSWSDEEVAAARLIADLAAGYLINTHLLGQSQTLAGQLQHALDSRIVIEQAKGVMAGRHGMTPEAAFEVLRSFARGNRLKLHDVARDVVSGRSDMLPLAESDGRETAPAS